MRVAWESADDERFKQLIRDAVREVLGEMSNPLAGKRWLTTDEVAEQIRVKSETLRYWRHVGKGPKGTRRGSRVFYEAAELARWLESEEDS